MFLITWRLIKTVGLGHPWGPLADMMPHGPVDTACQASVSLQNVSACEDGVLISQDPCEGQHLLPTWNENTISLRNNVSTLCQRAKA